MSSKAKGKGREKKVGKGKGKDKAKEGKSKAKFTLAKMTELENQFLIRMPAPYSKHLEEALENGGLKERLKVEFNEDARNAKVTFDGVTFTAKLRDLPCIVESWKTFDKKSLWKTGDICQILVCRDPEDPMPTSDDEESSTFDFFKKRLHEAKKYQHPHGITPPLKNVRKRRFRKTAKQKYVDAPEIEKEVKRLLRTDVSAVDVTFDVINDEQEKVKTEEPEEEIDVGGVPNLEQFDENSNMSSYIGSDIEVKPGEKSAEILPDISSSEDEDNEDGAVGHSPNKIKHTENLLSKRLDCENRLAEIKTKMSQQESAVRNAVNPLLKQRFQSVLDQLKEQEKSVLNELSSLPG